MTSSLYGVVCKTNSRQTGPCFCQTKTFSKGIKCPRNFFQDELKDLNNLRPSPPSSRGRCRGRGTTGRPRSPPRRRGARAGRALSSTSAPSPRTPSQQMSAQLSRAALITRRRLTRTETTMVAAIVWTLQSDRSSYPVGIK